MHYYQYARLLFCRPLFHFHLLARRKQRTNGKTATDQVVKWSASCGWSNKESSKSNKDDQVKITFYDWADTCEVKATVKIGSTTYTESKIVKLS